MIKLFNTLKSHWFETVFIMAILFIVLYGIYSHLKGNKGSWSDKYTYFPPLGKFMKKIGFEEEGSVSQKRGPPRESKGEIECNRVLEKIFGKPFKKIRPKFLNNPVTGGKFNMELDCYNDELKLAVEFNGIQHYQFVPYFHKNKETFYNQKYRDELKRRMCKDEGIILIEVPYNVKNENIEKYIMSHIKKYYEVMRP